MWFGGASFLGGGGGGGGEGGGENSVDKVCPSITNDNILCIFSFFTGAEEWGETILIVTECDPIEECGPLLCQGSCYFWVSCIWLLIVVLYTIDVSGPFPCSISM